MGNRPHPSEESVVTDDSLHESCGVFGILHPKTEPLGQVIFYGLYALQHRGQESCGMAVFDNDQLFLHKDMGLVNQVFSNRIIDKMVGQIGVGHTRYSTTGGSSLENAQPVVARSPFGALVLAHNGNLINTDQKKAELENQGFFCHGDSDSHVMAQLINAQLHADSDQRRYDLAEAVRKALEQCEGAFSLVIATGDTLIAARDRHGLRPLSLGRTSSGAVVIASETCALDIVGAQYERDIAPGEVFMAHRDGSSRSLQITGATSNNFCVFELVYFARPDSKIQNASVYTYRMALGKRLAEISPPVEADIVIPVPDSGNVAAVGYSQASGIPYVEGLIKNRYVGRTFIHPTQELREQGIQLKLNPLTDILNGKRVIVVDDSIVRGNTSRKLVKMLRSAGVQSIHLRISSAQVKHPCFYGIDMSSQEELIANKMSLDELQAWLGVDSLVYLSEEDMRQVAANASVCMACFNGDYPAGRPEEFASAAALAESVSGS
jgi:amidophosphoribosyltransferase